MTYTNETVFNICVFMQFVYNHYFCSNRGVLLSLNKFAKFYGVKAVLTDFTTEVLSWCVRFTSIQRYTQLKSAQVKRIVIDC